MYIRQKKYVDVRNHIAEICYSNQYKDDIESNLRNTHGRDIAIPNGAYSTQDKVGTYKPAIEIIRRVQIQLRFCCIGRLFDEYATETSEITTRVHTLINWLHPTIF